MLNADCTEIIRNIFTELHTVILRNSVKWLWWRVVISVTVVSMQGWRYVSVVSMQGWRYLSVWLVGRVEIFVSVVSRQDGDICQCS
jgi:hypothetical protein